MDTRIGVWLDRKVAYVVTLKNGSHSLKVIASNINFRVRDDGEGKVYTRLGDQYMTKEKAKEAKLEQQLKDYYKSIIALLKGVDEVYIFGPAEAKNELNKMILEQSHHAIKVSAIEASDKLTENQIIAAVKKHFNV
jgi:hypothetical protein